MPARAGHERSSTRAELLVGLIRTQGPVPPHVRQGQCRRETRAQSRLRGPSPSGRQALLWRRAGRHCQSWRRPPRLSHRWRRESRQRMLEANPPKFADGKQTVHFSDKALPPWRDSGRRNEGSSQPAPRGGGCPFRPVPAIGRGLYWKSKNDTADYVFYGKEQAAAPHGSCTSGSSSQHSSGQGLARGCRYYVSKLGKTASKKRRWTTAAGLPSRRMRSKVDGCTCGTPRRTPATSRNGA